MTDQEWAALGPLIATSAGANQAVAAAIAAQGSASTPRAKIEALVTTQQARLNAQGARIAVIQWVKINLGLDITGGIGGDA